MKRSTIALFCLIFIVEIIASVVALSPTRPVTAQVIRNASSGMVGGDSISLPFVITDSAGNPRTLILGDSIFVAVFNPSGVVSAWDSGAYNDSRIKSRSLSSFFAYAWSEAGNKLDGASPSDGVYSYVIFAKSGGNGRLGTPSKGFFQLFSARTFSQALNLASDTSLYTNMDILLDSVGWVQGVGIGAFSFSIRNADVDSLFYGVLPHDTLFIKVYTGKLSGNIATKVVPYTDR